jgi:hypothetical protein
VIWQDHVAMKIVPQIACEGFVSSSRISQVRQCDSVDSRISGTIRIYQISLHTLCTVGAAWVSDHSRCQDAPGLAESKSSLFLVEQLVR